VRSTGVVLVAAGSLAGLVGRSGACLDDGAHVRARDGLRRRLGSGLGSSREHAHPEFIEPGHAPTHAKDADAFHDRSGAEAIEKVREVAKKADTCFLVTHGGVRPMGVREIDEDGTIWFLSDKHSHKNAEIEANPEVELYFQASEHSGFMHLTGQATVLHDKSLIDKLWTPLARVWFEQGKDDPASASSACSPPGASTGTTSTAMPWPA
jgi:general stress protein 26